MTSSMETLQEAMDRLRRQGYDQELDIRDGRIVRLPAGAETWSAEEVAVQDTLRFEGPSAPEDMSVLFAVQLPDGGRGLLVGPYGPTSTVEDGEVMRQLQGR